MGGSVSDEMKLVLNCSANLLPHSLDSLTFGTFGSRSAVSISLSVSLLPNLCFLEKTAAGGGIPIRAFLIWDHPHLTSAMEGEEGTPNTDENTNKLREFARDRGDEG